MLKAKNIIVLLVLNYCIMLGVSAVGELLFLADKAQHIQNLIRTAGDMALEQTQVTDDFFITSSNPATPPYKMSFPSSDGNGYKKLSMYNGIYNKSETIASNREAIYKKLYDTADFKDFSKKLGAIRTPVRYWDSTESNLVWYTVPRLAEMGTNILPDNINTKGVKYNGANVNSSIADKLFANYYMDNYKKQNGLSEYYITPISLGVTYLNEDLLGTLFMNNLDLLMRTKYASNGINLNTEAGGNGIYKGSFYADTITDNLSMYNPINDGKFTLLRGIKSTGGNSSVDTFVGTKPKIEYKVIDMYDSANDTILTSLFGAKKVDNSGINYSSKAAYLKALDKYRLDPSTGSPYTSKPIVVAKVTFYADVIVPYTTPMILDFRKDDSGHYLDVERVGTSGVSGVVGSDKISYTRYFAVTP